ncbi:MAG: hypothetical protein GY746_11225 [Gammaproteobacteria bacterium]|nr:hypothetical protein [Gammaproteobacteria bacterium]
MTPSQQHTARDVASWRERRAQQRDLPREWILKKQAVIGIARAQPESMQQLGEIEGLTEKVIQRIGKQLLSIVARKRGDNYKALVPPELTNEQRSQARKVMARLREIGEAQHIAPSLMANRSVIECLVAGERNVPLLKGWRAEVAGNELLGMLNG